MKREKSKKKEMKEGTIVNEARDERGKEMKRGIIA